jgi:predicted alpha/beta-hydrolase family hydrolase
VLLAPGAGSDRNEASLVAIEAALAPLPVWRMDFPYRIAGRKAPDRAPVLIAALAEALDEAEAQCGAGRLVIGGRSMGGRMASMLVAQGRAAAGLVLISYPLHPPGRPDKLRTEHLPAVNVPCLFVSGTRDAFATPDELTAATSVIEGPVTHVWLEGGDHGLRRHVDQVVAAVGSWVKDLGAPRRGTRGRLS